jgi:hypothetical protein
MGGILSKCFGVLVFPLNLWEITQVVGWAMVMFLQSLFFRTVEGRPQINCGSRSVGLAKYVDMEVCKYFLQDSILAVT